jgi:hypothetical protein
MGTIKYGEKRTNNKKLNPNTTAKDVNTKILKIKKKKELSLKHDQNNFR